MSHSEIEEIERRLKAIIIARVTAGILAVLAIGAVVPSGVAALAKEENSWQAMRLPLMASVLFLWIFARCAKAIAVARERLNQRNSGQNAARAAVRVR
jgi:hypothetical protein